MGFTYLRCPKRSLRRLSENRLRAHFSEKSLEILQNMPRVWIISQRKYSDNETWMVNDDNNIWQFLYWQALCFVVISFHELTVKGSTTTQIPFKKDTIEFKQRALFATKVFDLLPSDHQRFVYEDIFEQLDTSSVEEQFSVRGQNAYHPRLINFIKPPATLVRS